MASKQLVSPMVEYMRSNEMVADVTTEIAPNVKQVEITFATSGVYGLQIWKPYYFKADETLNGSAIKGIEAVTRSQLSTLPDGSQTFTSADVFAKALLWIIDRSGDVIVTLPLNSLISSDVTIATAFDKIQRFCLEDVVWQKCYITLHDTTGISAGESIYLNIYYDKDGES